MRAHPEFAALPAADRDALEKANAFRAVALGHARFDSPGDRTPEETWDWMLGEGGRRAWRAAKEEAALPREAEPVKRYRLRDVGHGRLTEEELARFEKLCRRLEPTLHDDRVFPVALLLVLFSGGHRLSSPESRAAVAAVQRRYVVTLKRTLCCEGDGDDDRKCSAEHYAAFLDSHLLEVNMCLRELTEIVYRHYQRIHASLCSC